MSPIACAACIAVAGGGVLTTTQAALAITPRSIDGTGNNLINSDQGAAGQPLIRFGYDAFYPDGVGDTMLLPPTRPNAREISNVLSAQTASLPNSRNLSDFIWQWGQFLTHDLDLTPNDSANNNGADFNVVVPNDDPVFANGTVIPFNRSNFQTVSSIREQVNDVTNYIDASNVYGSDQTRADALRAPNGKLLTSAGNMPMFNTPGLPNDGGPGTNLFLAGDVRANEQVGLTTMHTLFVREHNRLADRIIQLDQTQNFLPTDPTDRDNEIYQLAKKIVGAELQIITYNEFLPALMGGEAPNPQHFRYFPSVDASITQTFAHALFRFGHSMTNPTLRLVDELGNADALSLADAFFNPEFFVEDASDPTVGPQNIDRILRGLATQQAQENDLLTVEELRSVLFGPPGVGMGLDLITLDIQRGRDHGLPDYLESRDAYFLPIDNFDFEDITSDTALQDKLRDLYTDTNDIDLFVAGLAEDHLPGASIGETMAEVIRVQFERLRDGDRFFYLGDPDLYEGDLDPNGVVFRNRQLLDFIRDIVDLDTLKLSDVIAFNTGAVLQENVFFAVPEPASAVIALAGVATILTRRQRTKNGE